MFFNNLKKICGIALLFLILQVNMMSFVEATVGENIALGKNYILNENPNYSLCKDDGDKTDLTDGKYAKPAKSMWVQHQAVGWVGLSPLITIDLEEVKSISGISYSTAAGQGGVTWPKGIAIFVSDNNIDYYFVDDLVYLSTMKTLPASQGYVTHRFKTCELKTKGRYVRLAIIPSGTYTFCDEIEVYEGPTENLQLPPGELVKKTNEFIQQFAVLVSIRSRILTDKKIMEALINRAAITEKTRQQFHVELSQIESDIKQVSLPAEDFRAIAPINSLHERLFKLRAKLLRAEGYPELIYWKNNRWDNLTLFDTPDKDDHSDINIQAVMMCNEYRSEAFNISNFSDMPLTAKLKIEGLPPGTNPDYITVHQVEYVDTKRGEVVSTALPLAKRVQDGYEITLPSGLTRQVWLTLNPKEVNPGNYKGRVIVEVGEKTNIIPLHLTLCGLEFPQKPALSLGMWDYTDPYAYGINKDNRTVAIDDMQHHFVDTPWARSRTVPWPSAVTKTGDKYEMAIDYRAFDEWIQSWGGSRNYAIFLNVGSTFGPRKAAMNTDEFKETVSLWAKLWSQHIKDLGQHPSQFLLLLIDEPQSQDGIERIIAWSHAIKAGERDFVIWQDIVTDPWKTDPRLFEVSDTLCVSLYYFLAEGKEYQGFYEDLRQQGKTLWFYNTLGPASQLDPYYYYRLQQWHAWDRGAKGVGFWAYGDTGGIDPWNEYKAGGTCYSPLYIGQSFITTSKHWEAVREGIEDFEYLKILEDLLTELKARGLASDEIAQAEIILQEAPTLVLGEFDLSLFQWHTEKDRSAADQQRIRILEAIQTLLPLIK